MTDKRYQLSDRQWLLLCALKNITGGAIVNHDGSPMVATPERVSQEADFIALSWYGKTLNLSPHSIGRTMASLTARGFTKPLPSPTRYQLTQDGQEISLGDVIAAARGE
jgi:hypothetical protein